ncbi:hypothetical protein F5888DRAFT_1637921 [Russula emetica]|nr:hypothetical protein F5888DRAFT_1637921 [Russula emetica]
MAMLQTGISCTSAVCYARRGLYYGSYIIAAVVLPEGRTSPKDAGPWMDSQIAPLKQIIVGFSYTQGAKVGIQLAHPGRKASTLANPLQRSAYRTWRHVDTSIALWPMKIGWPDSALTRARKSTREASDLIRRRATESHAKAPGATVLHRPDQPAAGDAERIVVDLTDDTFGGNRVLICWQGTGPYTVGAEGQRGLGRLTSEQVSTTEVRDL